MNKRIYLIIIYITTAFCIIAGILGNIFNAAPFNLITTSSSGSRCDFYEELKAFSNITIDGTVADINIVKDDTYSFKYEGGERFKATAVVNGSTLNVTQSTEHFLGNIKNADCTITIGIPENVSISDLHLSSNVVNFKIDSIDIDYLTTSLNMGNFKATKSNIEKINAEINMGNCKFDNCTYKSAIINVDMGNLTIRMPENKDCGYDLSVDMGNITLYNNKCSNTYTNNLSSSTLLKATVNMGNISINN